MRNKLGQFIKGMTKNQNGSLNSMWKGGNPTFVCEICNKEFKGKRKSKQPKHHFCSLDCRYEFRRTKFKHSAGTKAKMSKASLGRKKNYDTWSKGKNKFNNKKLAIMAKNRKGKNNPAWKNGISPLVELIRATAEYTLWRKQVYYRDNFVCVECGNKNIHSHHIKRFSLIMKEFLQMYSQFSPIEDKEILVRLSFSYKPFWDIDNGKTLCVDCHKIIHAKMEVML